MNGSSSRAMRSAPWIVLAVLVLCLGYVAMWALLPRGDAAGSWAIAGVVVGWVSAALVFVGISGES